MYANPNVSTKDKLKQVLLKPVLVGGVQYGLARWVDSPVGVSDKVRLMNTDTFIGRPEFFGLVGVGSAFIGELAHTWILPAVNKDRRSANWSSMVAEPLIGAAGSLAAAAILQPGLLSSNKLLMIAGMGAVSEIAGQRVFEILNPML